MIGSTLISHLADCYPTSRCLINILCLCITLLFCIPLLPLQSTSISSSLLPLFAPLSSSLLCFSSLSSMIITLTQVNTYAYRICLFGIGFSLNGPKALLLLQATQESVQFCQPYYSSQKEDGKNSIPTGTISGMIGFLAQVGASGSGYLMGYYLEQSFDYYWYILFLASGCLLLCLCMAWTLFSLEETILSLSTSTSTSSSSSLMTKKEKTS